MNVDLIRNIGNDIFESETRLEVGIGTAPICGYAWIETHRRDLDNWYPTFEMSSPGHKTSVIVRDRETEKSIIKMLRAKK